MNNVHEQCPNNDSETVLSPKLGWVHQVHTLNPCWAPWAHALRPGPCACSACYVPAQPSICHNTAEPTVCLLSLQYATIQPSLLCACSAFYMPQYTMRIAIQKKTQQPAPAGHNTLQCIVTHAPAIQPPKL